MEPASAAAILSEMTNDLTLVAKIPDSMQTSKSALILQNTETNDGSSGYDEDDGDEKQMKN